MARWIGNLGHHVECKFRITYLVVIAVVVVVGMVVMVAGVVAVVVVWVVVVLSVGLSVGPSVVEFATIVVFVMSVVVINVVSSIDKFIGASVDVIVSFDVASVVVILFPTSAIVVVF